MPYKVVKTENGWQVVNKETGKVKGTHKTREKAISQMRLLYGIEHGWKPVFSQRALKKAAGR